MPRIRAMVCLGLTLAALAGVPPAAGQGASRPVGLESGPSLPGPESTFIDGEWQYPVGLFRRDASAVFDPIRQRVILFGGTDSQGRRGDLWTLATATLVYAQLQPAGTPASARFGHAAIYDPVRDRMIVFGGRDNAFRNDVWELSLAGVPTWSQLQPSGMPPSPRTGHAAIYDPVGDRLVVVGGADTDGFRSDAWALSLSGAPVWTELSVAGTPPAGRWKHSLILDAAQGRAILFGGLAGGTLRNDVWSLSLSGAPSWTELFPAGTPPPARSDHTAIYDPPRGRMLIFGGTSGAVLDDLWSLSLTGAPAWLARSPAPPARTEHVAVYDPIADRMFTFGGWNGSVLLEDTWRLFLPAGPSWTQVTASGTPPPPRSGHTAIYDALRRRVVVFGGWAGNLVQYFNDTWVLGLDPPSAWSKLASLHPIGRMGHTAIYDPVRDRMIVYGGYTGGTPRLGDTWQLRLSGNPPVWEELFPVGGPPPARSFHTAIYDPVGDRMIVFGGENGTSGMNDTWSLSLSGVLAWSPIAASGSPTRYEHVAIHDPARDRMIVFGGIGSAIGYDTWALSLSGTPNWSQFSPLGPAPPVRADGSAVHDPVLDRMVVFGGREALPSVSGVTRALSLSDTRTWSALLPASTPPTPRYNHAAVYDPVHHSMVVFGGGTDNSGDDDTWTLAWELPPVSTPSSPVADRSLAIEGTRPHPAVGAVLVSIVLPGPGPAMIEAFDLSGRRVLSQRLADLGPGHHSVRLRASEALRPGMYVLRLSEGGRFTTARVVVVH